MKKYNVKNYIRYKVDLTNSIHNIELKELKEYTRDKLIVMFLPLVENIGRNEPEKTIKSFLSKRIKGAIRRAIDINRGDIRIPEHKLNEIRKDNGKNHKMVAMFFNSIFLSIDEQINEDEDGSLFQIPDQSEPYNIGLMNIYLQSLLKKHLNKKEYEILRLSYGLDCDKHSANQIADILSIEGPSAYVRISEIKKEAVKKLIENVESNQIFDYL